MPHNPFDEGPGPSRSGSAPVTGNQLEDEKNTNPFAANAPLMQSLNHIGQTITNPFARMAVSNPFEDEMIASNKAANPFDDDKEKSLPQAPVDPFGEDSLNQSTVTTGSNHTGNPFDFDADFEEKKKKSRVGTFFKKKQPEKKFSVLSLMNEDDDRSLQSSHLSQGHRRANSEMPTPTKPKLLRKGNRSRTTEMNFNFFKKNMDGFDEYDRSTDGKIWDGDGRRPSNGDKPKKRNNKNKNANIQKWPYDDYHEQIRNKPNYHSLPNPPSVDDQTDNYHTSSTPTRPPSLPPINSIVQNLPLTDFEKVAESRAISIVSTWLYDSGLLDELLLHGGLRKSTPLPLPRSDGSVISSEGIEIGHAGFPVLPDGKIEKQVNIVKSRTQKELDQINTRLNEGVSASGAEVQQLVNSFVDTQKDLAVLRQLTTYITTGLDPNEKNSFMLSQYPKLKLLNNARRNLFRCFRELDFFAQMPSTCERLREELYSNEWTSNEWSTIRSVCMEHVELEILLVEAQAGMIANMKDEGDEGQRGFRDYVESFLKPYVDNVWELGEEIRVKILSGIGSAFDLAMNNPAAMVALVEAVEVYERATEQYREVYGEKQTLHFTNMRASALAQIYQDFELRGLEVFRMIHMSVADNTDEEADALSSQFSGVLSAATELVAEIELVRTAMAPCFPPFWSIEVLWSSCVAHVCSNQILQQIGGPEGQGLVDLSTTQLLDLVAWVEYFREHIEETFPTIAKTRTSKKTYFDSRPEIFSGKDKKEVDTESATDSIAWANNMLWEVHRLAQEEFLMRTREQTNEWINNTYNGEHSKTRTHEGRLTSSLCEDVISVIGVQFRTLQEHLSKKSDALVMAVCLIFNNLRSKQIHSRDRFLQDFETCCEAANDFTRMSENCEQMLDDLIDECEFSEDSIHTLRTTSGELLALYSADAVYAAQMTHKYIFEPIDEAIGESLFGEDWLEHETSNTYAATLVATLKDYMGDCEQFLESFMVNKTLEALVSGSVMYYTSTMLSKIDLSTKKNILFGNLPLTLERMNGDIKVMRDYFQTFVKRHPVLERIIEREFEFLDVLQECLRIAEGMSDSDASDFILVVHKRIGDVELTKYFFTCIWILVNPSQTKHLLGLFNDIEDTLNALSESMQISPQEKRGDVPKLKLIHILEELNEKSKEKKSTTGAVGLWHNVMGGGGGGGC